VLLLLEELQGCVDDVLCQPLSKTKEWPRPGCTVEADRPGGSPGVELEGRLLMS